MLLRSLALVGTAACTSSAPVSIHVATNGIPAASVPVVFSDSAGATVADLRTDLTGIATAEVERDGSITIVQTTQHEMPAFTTVLTITEVQPGDTLYVDGSPPSQLMGMYSVSFSAYPGAASYRVYSPCGPTDTTYSPATLLLYTGCYKQLTAELQVHALDGAGNVLGYVTATTINYAAAGSILMPSTYASFQPLDATFTNVPPLATASLARRAPDQSGYSAEVPLGVAGTTASATVSGPATTNVEVTTTVIDAAGAEAILQQRLAGNATSYAVDFAASLLPWVHQPTFELASGTITVPVSAYGTSGDTADALTATLSYTRGSNALSWAISGPMQSTITLPTLPPELADLGPAAADTITTFAAAAATDVTHNWEEYRDRFYSQGGPPDDTTDVMLRISTSGDPF